MVKFASTLLLASIFGALAGARPVNVDTLARRDYNAVNVPAYNRKIVVVTVTETAGVTVTYGDQAATPTAAAAVTQPSTQPPAAYAAASASASASASAPAPASSSSNDWRVEMLSQVNAVRAKAGKSALQLSDQLNSFAQEHSDYQDSIKTMTHSDPSGSLGTRFVAAGISWTGAAENVAVGQQDVSAVVQAWVNSPDHYANMIGDYTYAGFGENNLYWTQDFLGTA